MKDRATTMKEIPGHPDQLRQKGCECLIVESSQLSDQLIEEAGSPGVLLRLVQLLKLLEGLHDGLGLLGR